MFCFCLQSSLLKLQALEVDGAPSLGPSPEGSPPALGSKEQKSPCSSTELGGEKEVKTLALCHNVDENSPPEQLTVLCRPPQSPRHQPLTSIQQPLTPDGAPLASPHHSPYSTQRSSPGGEGGGGGGGGGGGEGGGGALLQLLAGGPSPLPSPRCSSLSHSLRFNSDPDTAPSPPCSQQYMLSRGRARTEAPEDECPSSIPFLTRQIQTLKKKVRRFEDQFEQEMNYKPSHNDKYSNPEMVRVMNELAKARKQLKELRLRQSVFESKEQEGQSSDVCRYSSVQQGASEHKPTLEETVESLFRRLKEKRQTLGLPDNMKEMTQAQMVLEKITLQKCLLYFESLHGRPGTKQEKNLVKPLYDRYQMIKHLLCASPTISTIEEEDDDASDEDDSTSSMTVEECPVPPPRRVTRPASGEEDSDRDSDPAFVSPMDEVKAVRQQPVLTMSNLHEASRCQLLECLRQTRAEKKARRKVLREFEEEFHRQTGRICQKEDRTPMKDEYQEYKQLKAKLRLLEVLLSKQEDPKTM